MRGFQNWAMLYVCMESVYTESTLMGSFMVWGRHLGRLLKFDGRSIFLVMAVERLLPSLEQWGEAPVAE